MRALGALTAGLVIAVVVIEAVAAGLAVLLPETMLQAPVADHPGGQALWPLLPIPALVWMLGALAGGAMTAAAGPHPAFGALAGAVLAVPAALIVGLITPGSPLLLLAAAVPLAGAGAGAVLVARLVD